jgi:chemotaxis protein CheC
MYEESAKKVNQILWEEVPNTVEVLNLSSISAIKEMGNIVGSCFLNRLADSSGVELRPGEPLFVYDLMEAVMEALLIEQSLSSDRAIIVDTVYQKSSRRHHVRHLVSALRQSSGSSD